MTMMMMMFYIVVIFFQKNESCNVKICYNHDQFKPPKPLSDIVELENFRDIMNHLSVIVAHKQVRENLFVNLIKGCLKSYFGFRDFLSFKLHTK